MILRCRYNFFLNYNVISKDNDELVNSMTVLLFFYSSNRLDKRNNVNYLLVVLVLMQFSLRAIILYLQKHTNKHDDKTKMCMHAI